MFLLPIKLDRVSFETMGRQNLQKTADFLIESIVFCPLVPPSWISLVDPTSAMYASAIYVSYIYGIVCNVRFGDRRHAFVITGRSKTTELYISGESTPIFLQSNS